MQLKPQDFPLYELLVRSGGSGADRARSYFEKAQTGGADDRFEFALGIYTIAIPQHPPSQLPGETRQMAQQTLKSCLVIFEDAAMRGHSLAAYMSACCYSNGFGCAKDVIKAKMWMERAEVIDGPKPWIQEMRNQLEMRPGNYNGPRP